MKTGYDNIVIKHKGFLDHKVIENILNDFNDHIIKHKHDLLLYKRTYAVLEECLDNIYKHFNKNLIARNFNNGFMPEIEIHNNDDGFTVICSNPVENKNIDQLQKRLESLHNLSRKELKTLYKQKIRENHISHKGGAGLGLITMALKSINPLNYHIKQMNKNYSYFTLTIKLKNIH